MKEMDTIYNLTLLLVEKNKEVKELREVNIDLMAQLNFYKSKYDEAYPNTVGYVKEEELPF